MKIVNFPPTLRRVPSRGVQSSRVRASAATWAPSRVVQRSELDQCLEGLRTRFSASMHRSANLTADGYIYSFCLRDLGLWVSIVDVNMGCRITIESSPHPSAHLVCESPACDFIDFADGKMGWNQFRDSCFRFEPNECDGPRALWDFHEAFPPPQGKT